MSGIFCSGFFPSVSEFGRIMNAKGIQSLTALIGGIPLAAGCFIPLFGWTLNPMFGAAAMSFSSFSVVSNALRLNLFKLHNADRDRRVDPVDISGVIERLSAKDDAPARPAGVEMRLEIEDMMCEHCEARVKKALEKLPGVLSASVDYRSGTAILLAAQPVEQEILKQAVEAEDYSVKSVFTQQEA